MSAPVRVEEDEGGAGLPHPVLEVVPVQHGHGLLIILVPETMAQPFEGVNIVYILDLNEHRSWQKRQDRKICQLFFALTTIYCSLFLAKYSPLDKLS